MKRMILQKIKDWLFADTTKKILIVTSGNVSKIDAFADAAKKLKLKVTLASLADLYYKSFSEGVDLKIGGYKVSDFDLIYLRIVGKSLEEATLLTNFAKANNIQIVDFLYANTNLLPLSVAKSLEIKSLLEHSVPVPKTLFGGLKKIQEDAPAFLGLPFVIKSTTGKKAREVWIVENRTQMSKLMAVLREKELEGMNFFAQKFLKASQRTRVLVVGNKAVGAITRPTKWRSRFIDKNYKPKKQALIPIPRDDARLAVLAASAVGLDICGVDILREDKNPQNGYIIEANAAPSWELIKKDCNVPVEEEILSFLTRI